MGNPAPVIHCLTSVVATRSQWLPPHLHPDSLAVPQATYCPRLQHFCGALLQCSPLSCWPLIGRGFMCWELTSEVLIRFLFDSQDPHPAFMIELPFFWFPRCMPVTSALSRSIRPSSMLACSLTSCGGLCWTSHSQILGAHFGDLQPRVLNSGDRSPCIHSLTLIRFYDNFTIGDHSTG